MLTGTADTAGTAHQKCVSLHPWHNRWRWLVLLRQKTNDHWARLREQEISYQVYWKHGSCRGYHSDGSGSCALVHIQGLFLLRLPQSIRHATIAFMKTKLFFFFYRTWLSFEYSTVLFSDLNIEVDRFSSIVPLYTVYPSCSDFFCWLWTAHTHRYLNESVVHWPADITGRADISHGWSRLPKFVGENGKAVSLSVMESGSAMPSVWKFPIAGLAEIWLASCMYTRNKAWRALSSLAWEEREITRTGQFQVMDGHYLICDCLVGDRWPKGIARW